MDNNLPVKVLIQDGLIYQPSFCNILVFLIFSDHSVSITPLFDMLYQILGFLSDILLIMAFLLLSIDSTTYRSLSFDTFICVILN